GRVSRGDMPIHVRSTSNIDGNSARRYANRGPSHNLPTGVDCVRPNIEGLQPRRQHSGFVEAFAERGHKTRRGIGRAASDESDHRYRLLRVPCERPRGRRGADERYEPATIHSITSSARASSVAGTSMLSILAVWALMTSSNLVGVCTGRSLGFSPLRI